ncbi:ABC transporter transmembrane domain-containing protein [Pseudanabaena sp. PCC 6802]|uniref:ABC transporter transmembrane domain-containing protein n=1 Tax=Pseudanabaena sp. PCC 6802 TaxID=118173 RepID=UPI00034C73B8|nr:ABC transporter transmembrane domain-containing protein [Pseudanabaena sp. PCC 6802]
MAQELPSLFFEYLTNALGQVLSEQVFDRYIAQITVLKPSAGKLFWQTDKSEPGIHIVIEGKVRLLHHTDNLIATIEAGGCFGENTLFPSSSFQPYSARASVNVKLLFLPAPLLKDLIGKYPTIKEHIKHQAILRDWLLLCPEIAAMQKLPGLMKALSLLEKHELPNGQLPDALQNQKLWFMRRGQLLNTSGQELHIGCIYAPSQQKAISWQVVQASELYILSSDRWDEALNYCPQFDRLVSSRNLSKGLKENFHLEEIEPQFTTTPEPEIQPKSQKKLGKAYFPNPTLQVGHLWQRVIRRYPFFQQQSASDCGAACLVMVSRYWGKHFSVNRLREIANVDRNGASLRGLAAAAESVGFTTRPVKASLNKLAEQNLPAIVHWEGRHYIVVYRVTRDRAIVCDPAIGQRVLTHTEFLSGWTGYTLLLQPTALLRNTEETKQSFWQFFELIKPHRLILLEVFIASILIQIFGLVTPLFTQLLLDRVLVQRSDLTLTAVGIGLLIFSLFRVAMTGLRQYFLDQTANRVDLALIVGFISHTFRLPLKYFESRYVGDIISRVQENRKIQRFLTGEALSIILDLLTVFIYVGLMFWYSWKMGLLVLVIIPPFVLLALFATPFLQRISREIFSAYNEETGYLIQALTGIRTVKALAVEQTVRWRWEEFFGKSILKNFSGQSIGNTLQIFSSTIEAVMTTILLWFGAWQVIQNELTIGQLIAFNMLLGNVINPFKRLIVLWNELQEVIIAVERINDVIDADPEEDLHHQARQFLPPIKGFIRFLSVTFRYHPESDVNTLENLSFDIQPGQMVALVGRSGSGKTTISKLLLGLYPPTSGKILIDGYDVSTLSLRSLRQQIGVVDQDTFLFGSTIRENISLGHPQATLEEVIEAAEQAGAHQFIKELPMGYETQIGEGGGMLSGGQRQRLAIARALLGNPRLLILDEATSNLDAESERIIQTNLNKILKDRTTLVIAHRLSTVRNADLILVLDRGILIESGNHNELMAKCGHYFYLNQQQLAVTV